MFESLDANDIPDLLDRFADFLLPVVASDRRLVKMTELWKCHTETQKRLVGALGDIDSWEVEERDEIVSAQLTSGADDIADQMAAWLGTDVVRAVLDWARGAAVSSA